MDGVQTEKAMNVYVLLTPGVFMYDLLLHHEKDPKLGPSGLVNNTSDLAGVQLAYTEIWSSTHGTG